MENHTTQRRRTKSKPTIKRLLANKCERERVRKINEAFEILKTHIPYCDSGRIRTKLDVLKFAIDYIQILTKMVSQNEAATLLRSSQLENESAFVLSTEESETESLRSSTEMFPVRLGETSAFSFDEQQSQLGITSPTLSDDEVFFGANVTSDEILTGQYSAWSNNQSGFHQAQTYHHNERHTSPRRTSSFDEQLQDVSPLWLNQASGNTRPVMSLNGANVTNDEILTGQYSAWSNNQSGFHQAQTYHHNERHTSPRRTSSFDEQLQDESPLWLNQANGNARAVMSLNGSTTPPSDSNNNEPTEWLHL